MNDDEKHATVVLHAVMSLDGYVADPDDDPGPLFDWYVNGDQRLVPGDMDDPVPGGMWISAASFPYVRGTWDATGAMVIGRRLFDITDGWAGRPPAGEHVVVVSHRPRPEGWHPEASYHFVDDVTGAVRLARELAGHRDVEIAAGDVGGQALALGLVDEVAVDLAPVVLGEGKRYFGDADARLLLEDPHTVIQGNRVLHLRYRVRHQAACVTPSVGAPSR